MKADLYTSLVRAKQELNGGTLPAMTPVPENVQHFIDPGLTPGLGALEEDVDLGLRCPVRGCGQWFTRLRHHLNTAHTDLGGAASVLRALSIPESVGLDTQVFKARLQQRALEHRHHSVRNLRLARMRLQSKGTAWRASAARRASRSRVTVGCRNLRNTCEAQIAHRIVDLHNKLGRSPSVLEARALDGPQLTSAATRMYGSWNAALAAVGLKTRRHGGRNPRYDRDSALLMLREFLLYHGRMPTQREAQGPKEVPLIPAGKVLIKLFRRDAESWGSMMERLRKSIDVTKASSAA